MIRVLLLIFFIVIISSSAIWMIENNGVLEISWLGYLIKTDILTSIIILIIAYYCLYITFTISSKIFSFNLGSLKKLFSPNKLKLLTKSLQKDEQSFETILQILQNIENGDYKEALKNHKQLIKTSKNQELNDFLLAKIHFCLGDYKKSQEIAKKLTNAESSMLILASELEISLQKNDEEKVINLADMIISQSPEGSQSKSLKKAIEVRLDRFLKFDKYQEAKELLVSHDKISKDQDFAQMLAYLNAALAKESFDKKSFIAAIRCANRSLRIDPDYIPAHEIRLKSWLALGFTFKAKNEIKKLWKKSSNLIFVDIFDQSNQGLSSERKIKSIKKFLGVSKGKDIDFALALVAFRNKDYSLAKTTMNSLKSKKISPQGNKMLHFLNKILNNDSVIEEKSSNYQDEAKDLGKINHYNCSSCDSYFETWQPKCSSCSAINTLKN